MKIPLKIKCKEVLIDRMLTPLRTETYWVGFGDIGNIKNKTNQSRRFLQIRNAMGLCTYYYWTNPRKGEEVGVVFRFKRVKQFDENPLNK